jgi:hypothetical protein
MTVRRSKASAGKARASTPIDGASRPADALERRAKKKAARPNCKMDWMGVLLSPAGTLAMQKVLQLGSQVVSQIVEEAKAAASGEDGGLLDVRQDPASLKKNVKREGTPS